MTRKPVTHDKDLIQFVEDLKRQWMATVDAIVDPIMIVGPDYQVLKANLALAKFAKKSVKDVVGKKCFTVFAERKQPCDGCLLKEAVKKKSQAHFQLKKINPSQVFEVNIQPLFDEKNKLEGFVNIYRDRTEEINLQEQLAQREKLSSIGLLAGGVAHEINNPLGGIMVFSQMILRELPKDHKNYQDVVEIEEAAKRCKDIIENLLDFSRQRQAGKEVAKEKINLVDAMKTALRLAKVSIPSHLISIEENFKNIDECLIQGERNKLIQVFLNLIQNAVQAMPDGGVLNLSSQVKKNKNKRIIELKIQDTGVGIPEEYLQKIFDPFFTTKDVGQGTGLGLSISYGIIQDHQGNIQVSSKINKGTTFSITFAI